MPGPVSDSYDPVWGTAEQAAEVKNGIREVVNGISHILNSPPKYIRDVILEADGPQLAVSFSERELRIIRYAMRVALDEEEI